MDVQKAYSSELNSITTKETDYVESFKQDEDKLILDLKKKADKAFKNNEFEKAYNLYNQALQFNSNDYDLIACLTGAALNLGLMDEVFNRTDTLIQLDNSRAQGYYLKGIAYDLVFKFDMAIDFFLDALENEKENLNIVVKNLIKTVVKFIKKDENVKIDEPIETNDVIDNFLKLIELCETLMKKSANNELAIKILKFVQKKEPENYSIKTELLLVLGKFFKNQRNFDKAIITYEECSHLASLNDDPKLKIKSIVSISSCYLEMSDLHKVVYYYHKLVDLEGLLDSKKNSNNIDSVSTFSNSDIINLELRVAIRQNLFIAHYKLGKLRICCYYLSEIIDIIDKNFNNFNDENSIHTSTFDFIQIKIDASIELCKLYHIFEEFVLMKKLLDNILKFIENVIDKLDLNVFNQKQLNSLRYFKIKCYSHLGICLAGLREFRLSKLSTRKCLCLIDRELSKLDDSEQTKSDLFVLNSLKLECLNDATEATNQILRTFKNMKNFIYEPINFVKDKYDEYEIKTLIDAKKSRINTSKSAYLLSKNVLEPNLKNQAIFTLALSLYDNHLYQSAAYYFNQLLGLPSVDKSKSNLDYLFYSDANPDFKLESSVYLCKCQLLIDYYGVDSLVKYNDPELDTESDQGSKLDIENLYKNIIKTLEELVKYILKWRLHETNRSSFQFNLSNLEYLKQDKDSSRLKNLLKICSECLIYICYKLGKIEECLVYMELENFINDSNLNDLIELKLIDSQNEFNFETLSYENFFNFIKSNQNLLLRYKFIFDSKLLYVILVDPRNDQSTSIVFHKKIKTSQILNKIDDFDELDFYESKFEYLTEQFDRIQNDRIKNRINDFEYRSVPGSTNELGMLRIKNRAREKSYFNYLVQSGPQNYIFTFNFESINLYDLKLSEKLNETLEKFEFKSDLNSQTHDIQSSKNLINEILTNLIIDPISSKLNDFRTGLTILIDSVYTKNFVYIFNLFNLLNSETISYVITFDSFLKFSSILFNSLEKDLQEEIELNKERQEVLETPRRYQPLGQNVEKVHKSQIIPRYTSHPRQAVNLLNQNPDCEYVQISNDYLQKIKNRFDSSISILISETASGTNAKRSNIEVIDFKQINKKMKCCAIGCPDVPNKLASSKLNINRFLKNSLLQMREVSKLIYTEPIFSKKMTKRELIFQLETNNLIFLSTFSSNESDSHLICSQSIEFPSSFYEFDKYCKLTSQDLDLIDMHRCDLLVLNCYSSLNHKPRYDLVKKFMSRGCKSVLMVLNPMEDNLMTLFYTKFFENLKSLILIDEAYNRTVRQLIELNPGLDPIYINNSFVMVSTKALKISITEMAKSMLQLNVDKTLAKYEAEFRSNSLNLPPTFSILASNYVTGLEKSLVYLQISIKFLLNDLITDSKELIFSKNFKFEKIFTGLNDHVSRSIYFSKSNKMGPEPLNELLHENINSQNLLKCLGFSIQRGSVYTIRDEKDKKVILYPDNRYLDLNVRLTHVMSSLNDLCFKINDERVRLVVYNLEALLPIDDKNLLRCLIDLIAMTKFSPDVILNSTDYTVYYALNYFEFLNDNRKCKKVAELMNQDFFEWNFNFENNANNKIEIMPSDLCPRYSMGNKVVNFLLSLGFEIIGTFVRFNESILNRAFVDLILKFLSSFTYDRDMSLYKELNINVLGQRSAATRGLIKTASNLENSDLNKKKDDALKLQYGAPWCSQIETMSEMEKKVQFSIKYESLKEKISSQRQNALNHYMNYVLKQSLVNKRIEIISQSDLKTEQSDVQSEKNDKPMARIKYKKGGNPSKDRVIANEKSKLTYEQIEEIRDYSYLITRKNIEKIDLEFKEKSQKLLLPLIKK